MVSSSGGVHSIDTLPQPDVERAAERGAAVAKAGFFVMVALVSLLALLLLALAVFFRPLKRAVLLRHLERPLWHTPPTRRVENLWLRALIALEDLGFAPSATETPQQTAERARATFAERYGEVPAGVDAAASIIERVEYAGRGLSVDEEAKMRAAVTALLAWAGRHLGATKKLALGWAPLRSR